MAAPLQHPQEIEVWYILPAIRREIVIALRERGLIQKEIARLLRLTESAVSQYVQAKRGKDIFDNRTKKFISEASAKIVDAESAYLQVQQISHYVRRTKAICLAHMKLEKGLEGCDICFRKI